MISEHASPLSLLGGVDAGGQNVYVDAVSRGLVAHGYEVDIFTRNLASPRPEIADWAEGVRVVSLPFGPCEPLPKDDLWPFMAEFRDAIEGFAERTASGYDLIHGNFWMSGWVAAELRQRWGVPAVQIMHATGLTKSREQGSADTSPASRITVERAVVRAVDRLIAQCPAERDELLMDYGAVDDQVVLIPSAVDREIYRPERKEIARQRLGFDPEIEIIAYIGRFVPRKDIRNIVRALAHLKQLRLAVGSAELPILLLVGGESDEPDDVKTPEIWELRALAAEVGVFDRLRFVGRKQRMELRHWYAAADVVVTTPWYEPFGLTPLEAMACGRPVVGSDVGGISFTIVDGETGFLVPAKDPAALAARLDRLLRDADLRERMGRAGRMRVEREFTWERVALRTASLYNRLLGGRHDAVTAGSPSQPMKVGAASRIPGVVA
jgi:glycosyltransferase involved in cell wall biosynthesis